MILDRKIVQDSYAKMLFSLIHDLGHIPNAEYEIMQNLSVLCGTLALAGDNEDEVRQNSLIAINTFGWFIYELGKNTKEKDNV